MCANKVKNKNHRWASKRFKVTKKWKVIFGKTCNSHLMTNKGKNQKKYPYGKVLAKADTKSIKNLLSN